MAEFTPTTADIRARLRAFTLEGCEDAAGAAFDRWLAAHDAEVARQQAERDAQIVHEVMPLMGWTAEAAIRDQFGAVHE